MVIKYIRSSNCNNLIKVVKQLREGCSQYDSLKTIVGSFINFFKFSYTLIFF